MAVGKILTFLGVKNEIQQLLKISSVKLVG